ncbi:MAG TPA: intradiol ring-cleavage dioxygenase [Terriglobia bacterium]|nr:intradiol ring-cleavage dioxygenase [Terriglobia bacterium]
MKNTNLQLSNLKFALNLNRRAFVIGGAAILSSASRILNAAPRCTLTPEQEEGPYYVDFGKTRRDVTEGKSGVPLQLRIALVDSKRCEPLQAAAVDIWHCDATGVYSGFTANGGGNDGGRGFGPPPGGRGGPGRGGPVGRGGRGQGAIDETRFLRGIQVTDKEGIAEFASIYPGWYAGRTIHIHLKVHLGGNAGAEKYAGGHVSHTGQLFLPEDITEQIAKMEPYVSHSNVHRTLHSEDNIFRQQGGAQTMMHLERLQKGSNAGGFVADVVLAVDPAATPVVF